jgi:hypothetical protein
MRRAALLFAFLIPALALAQTMHDRHMGGMPNAGGGHPASEPGQAAFGAIQEIVEILETDPTTDWRNVNIDALRQHLIDMDNVTLHAEVKGETITGGMRFIVSGLGPVRDSIRRMVTAHAQMMNGVGDWVFAATNTDSGAVLTVTVPAVDADKLHGLGFIGVMTRGMHHQAHHLMIARGIDPHR